MFQHFAFVCGVLAVSVPTACAITRPSPVDAVVEQALTPLDAVRAQTDVQIRRIKSMIVNRQLNQDAAYELLQRLQKNLRG